MNRQKENIDLLIRKVFLIGLFLFALLLFKNTNSSVVESFNKSCTIETAFETDNSAILVEPVSFPSFDNSLVSCELFAFNNSNNENYKIICSNNKINHFLLLSNKQFLDIKTHLFYPYHHQVRASLNSEEIPSIS
jgi:hypothetical protein